MSTEAERPTMVVGCGVCQGFGTIVGTYVKRVETAVLETGQPPFRLVPVRQERRCARCLGAGKIQL